MNMNIKKRVKKESAAGGQLLLDYSRLSLCAITLSLLLALEISQPIPDNRLPCSQCILPEGIGQADVQAERHQFASSCSLINFSC